MKRDEQSHQELSEAGRPAWATRLAVVGAILLAALAARACYAWQLPLNGDERLHLDFVERISLLPDSLYLPLDTPVTPHPPGVLYLTALASWTGGGSVFLIRLVFIALSIVGLVGLYVLADSWFGFRVALVALALASLDRHLVAMAGVFLESPAVIFLAPWTIFAMRRCLTRGSARDWLATGMLFGLGFWLSTVFLVLLLPFALYVLLSGKLTAVLKSPRMYAGLALLAAMTTPYFIHDAARGGPNSRRNVAKVGELGLSPRAAVLYAGDLLILAKDPIWIDQNTHGKMYPPTQIPCNGVMGLVYLAAALASLRLARDDRVLLLLVVIAGVAAPVTLLDAREPWNEFTWASSTVYAAILLTAFVLDGTLSRKWGKVAAAALLLYAAGSLAVFLAGPKWGYFCPDWERAYVGRHAAANLRSGWNPQRFPADQAREEILSMARRATESHPESAIAWFYRGQYAETAEERNDSFRRVLEIDPNNPLVLERLALDCIQRGQWQSARELLERVLAGREGSFRAWLMLAETEFALGNYEASVVNGRRASSLKPEAAEPYRILFHAYDVVENRVEADRALARYVETHPEGPADAYRRLAEDCLRQGRRGRGRQLLDAASAAP